MIGELKKLKCRISNNDDEFKVIQYTDPNYVNRINHDNNNSLEDEHIILVCSSNHINKFEIEKSESINGKKPGIKFKQDWHDPKLGEMNETFNSMRRGIPDIDRERLTDFLSFCSLGRGHVYGAAICARIILEDFLTDIYYMPMINYIKSQDAENSDKNLVNQYKEKYKKYEKKEKKENTELRENIELKFIKTKLSVTKLIKEIEEPSVQPDGLYEKILSLYISVKSSNDQINLKFDKDKNALLSLWEITSGIVHGRQNSILQLIKSTEDFINALKINSKLVEKWKDIKEED